MIYDLQLWSDGRWTTQVSGLYSKLVTAAAWYHKRLSYRPEQMRIMRNAKLINAFMYEDFR